MSKVRDHNLDSRRLPVWKGWKSLLSLVLFSSVFLLPSQSKATHLMGVDLTYECLNNCTIRVHIRNYRDCSGTNGMTDWDFNWDAPFGCQNPNSVGPWTPGQGSGPNNFNIKEVTPVCDGTLTQCSGGSLKGVEEWHRYRDYNVCGLNCNEYFLTWDGRARNPSITSLTQPNGGWSPEQGMGVFSQKIILNLPGGAPCGNNSAVFNKVPTPYICAGKPFVFNAGATDPDGDSLAYKLGTCYQETGAPVQFNPGYSTTSPLGSSWLVFVNQTTGDVSFIPQPGNVEEGVLCVYVEEWRNGTLINETVRDIQVTVIANCPNSNPAVNGPQNVQNGQGSGSSSTGITINTCPGNSLCFDLPSFDADPGDTVSMWWNHNILGGQFFQTGNPTVVDTIVGPAPTGATFCWTAGLPGTYTFLVTMMDNACPSPGTANFTVTINVAEPTASFTTTPVVCGEVTLCANVSGGTPGFTYSWAGTGGLTSSSQCVTHTYPAQGTYPWALIVTDIAGCADTINASSNINTTINQVNAGADQSYCDGGSTVIGSPSAPDDLYLWTPSTGLSNPTAAQPTVTLSNPSGGPLTQTYILYDTNTSSGCAKLDTVTVTVGSLPKLAIAPTDIPCAGDLTGALDLTVTDGTPQFSYSWGGPQGYTSSQEDPQNLTGGAYTVNVTDSLGCSATANAIVNEPQDPLFPTLIAYNVSCNGGSDGAIDLVITGGQLPYTVSWSNGANTEDISNLSAGLYVATVTDGNGCEKKDSVILTEPGPINIAFQVQDAACNGESNGMLIASASGGHSNFDYFWPYTSDLNDTSFGFPAGTYNVIVTDTSYGPAFHQIFFEDFDGYAPWDLNVQTGSLGTDPNEWQISDNEGGVSPPNCGVQFNGDQTLHITNPNNPVSGADYEKGGNCGGGGPCPETNYRAESPAISTLGWTNLTLEFDFISQGDGLQDNFSVWYDDGSGWTQLVSTLKSPTCGFVTGRWSVANVPLPASCSNIADLKIGFNWTNDMDGVGSDPSVAINNVRILSPNNDPPVVCTETASATVGEPTALNLAMNATNISCYGGTNGTATAVLSGGHGNYSYLWSTGQISSGIIGLTAGTYSVAVIDTAITIADPAGYLLCNAVDSISIIEPDSITLNVASTPTSCFGGSDGTATVQPMGGTPPYAYLWSDGQITATATGLTPGTYTVTVQDLAKCQKTISVTVNEPAPLLLSTTPTNVTCPGGTDGSAIVSPSGGTPGYSYTWSTVPTQNTQVASNLQIGFYTVTVTDTNNCIATQNVIISEPQALNLQYTTQDVTCNGDGNGGITITNSSGGTGNHTYMWIQSGTPGPGLSNLNGGSYTVVLTDSVGCTDTTVVTVNEPAPIALAMAASPNTCAVNNNVGFATVTPSGGTAPYTYFWNTNPIQTTPNAINLATGTWVVTVTDANGCLDTAHANIKYIPAPTVVAGPNIESCFGEGGAQAIAYGNGGSQQYFFNWWCDTLLTYCGIDSINDNDPWLNPTTTTTYYVQITDGNGCVSNVDSLLHTIKPKPIVDAGPDIYLCGDSAPCQVLQASMSGAPGPYSYQWSPSIGLNNDTILNPCARPDSTTLYTLIAVASNGCKSNYTTIDTNSTVVVHVQPIPMVTAGTDHDICLHDSTKLQGIGFGAGPLYHYQWTPSLGLSADTVASPMASPPITTTYFLTVWSNKCPSISDTVVVNVHTLPTVDAGPNREICIGDTTILDGQVTGDSTSTFWNYSWWPNSNVVGDTMSEDLMANPAATTKYYFQSSSSWGCQSPIDSAIIYIKPMPWAEAGPNKVICYGDSTRLGAGWFYTTTDTVPNQDTSQINPFWTPGPLSHYHTWDPWAGPLETQYYYLTVEYKNCTSYDSVLVTVYPEIVANVDADTTTICGTDSVQLYAWGGWGNANFQWFPAGGLSHPDSANPMAAPSDSVTYTLVIEEGGCTDTNEVSINVIPRPDIGYISSLTNGCVPHTVNFLELAGPAFGFLWDFGDSTANSNEANPSHTYTQAGSYRVTLTATNVGQCSSMVDDLIIHVEDTAVAEYTSDPVYPVTMYLPEAGVQFTDLSQNAATWTWDFGDGVSERDQHPFHQFTKDGTYMVTLYVTNETGCVSKITHGPYIVNLPELLIPNIFSPNGDGNNDFFHVDYDGSQPFTIAIHDRWGKEVFYTKNRELFWDGNMPNGTAANEGVYFYTVFIGDKKFAGNVTLIR